MVMFDNIEEIFQTIRGYGDQSKALVTLTTAIGSLAVLFYSAKLVLASFRGFRLYVLNQFCCNRNTRQYGEWAVISGATDGIGQSMAREFAKRGHSILVIGRNEEKLARTKATLEAEPNVGRVETARIDLSDSSLENFAKIEAQIDADHRDIGILVNNAGLFVESFQRFARFEMKELHDLVNVNVMTPVYLTKMVLPGMVARQRGLVLNVSSLLGCLAAPYMSVYGATKTFLNRFSENLGIEYASHPIDIINLEPGAVHTKLFTASATLPKPTLMSPSPDDYARSALNAISARISPIAGTWPHALSQNMAQLFYSLGLLPFITTMHIRMNARQNKLSPVLRRKKTNGDHEPPSSSAPSSREEGQRLETISS